LGSASDFDRACKQRIDGNDATLPDPCVDDAHGAGHRFIGAGDFFWDEELPAFANAAGEK
jgi:hypothetical protein